MSYDDDDKTYGADIILDKSHCSWCKQPAPDGGALKRCRGCNISIYCGRECQASAWPTHKSLCRDRNALEPRTDAAGYETPAGLTGAMREWAELHKYALTVLAHAFLRRTGGGVDANLRLGRVVVFHLSTERPANAPPDDNPGVKFTLCNTTLIDAEQAPWFRDHPQLADADFGEPGFCGDAVDMKPAGFLPIVCLAEGSKFVAASYFPMYRAVRHPDDAPREAETVAAFRDITRLFITFINSGVVFRLPSSGHPAPPVAGNMVRMRKGWKWQEIRTTWAVILMGIMMHSEGILVFETTIPVTELWTRFWRW